MRWGIDRKYVGDKKGDGLWQNSDFSSEWKIDMAKTQSKYENSFNLVLVKFKLHYNLYSFHDS